MTTWNADMSAAPKDAEMVLVLIPTGDDECPYLLELAQWNDLNSDEERWDGIWRHMVGGFDGINDREPFAWALPPDVTDDLAALARKSAAAVPVSGEAVQ